MVISSEDSSRDNPPKVSIIMPFYHNSMKAGELHSHLWSNTKLPVEYIFVVDEDPLPLLLKQIGGPDGHVNCKIAYSPICRGITRACNAGIGLADGQYVAIHAVDHTVTPFWLEKLLWALEHNPEYGWVLAKSNHGVSSMCSLMAKDVVMDLGLYDEHYFRHWEDTDMYNKMAFGGYTPRRIDDCYVEHHAEQSVRQDDPNDPEYNRVSTILFEQKWREKSLRTGKPIFTDWGKIIGVQSGWPGYK